MRSASPARVAGQCLRRSRAAGRTTSFGARSGLLDESEPDAGDSGGGGEVSEGDDVSTAIDASKIEFGTNHAIPHFKGTGIDQSEVESAIMDHIVGQIDKIGGHYIGSVYVDGVRIDYHFLVRGGGAAKVGTYYVSKH